MELVSFGATMSQLSGNRFAMGFARGFDALYDIYGTRRANLQGLEEIAEMLRLLWSGETFTGENAVGQRLDDAMPQFDLDDRDVAALLDYLEKLSAYA